MTSFINDSGNEILVNEDVTFTRQVASFFSFQVKGDFSVTFKIPNTSDNRGSLGIYGIQQVNPDTKQEWNLYIKGNKILRGYLIIQKITDKSIDLFFISGNSNWIKELVENTTDLNLLIYVSEWEEQNVMVDSLLNTSGIVYPLADWAYNFNKTTLAFNTLPIYDSGDNEFNDFYPCFYLKDLVKEILQQSGFKLDGNILDDGIYNKVIITPSSGDIKRNPSFINQRTLYATKTAVQNLPVSATRYQLTFDSIINTTSLFSSNRYTLDAPFHVEVNVYLNTSVNQSYTVELYKNGLLTYGRILVGLEGYINFPPVSAAKNDYFEFKILVTSGVSANINANSTIEIKPQQDVKTRPYSATDQDMIEYVYPNDFIKLKCVDIIKFVVMYFGCYAYFDDHSKKITINILDKIRKDLSLDWSEYLQSYETVYDPKQAANNYIRLSEPIEPNLVNYNSRYFTGFGDLNITTTSEINKANELYRAPFQASEAQITIKYGQLLLPYISLVELQDDNEYLEYTTVTDSSGYAQFNGEGFNFRGNEVIRILDNNSIYSGYLVIGTSATYNAFLADGMAFKGTSTGVVYKQRASYKSGKNRILINLPDVDLGLVSGGGGAGSTPFEVYAIWILGISGASWSIAFSNNATPNVTKTFTVSFGSGETTHRNLNYDSSTMHIVLSKLNNGGLAQDSGTINVYKNAAVLLATSSFVVTNDVSNVTFDLTGLVAGDIVYVSFNES